MKVYLDDVRDTPEGWIRCYWPEEVIQLLKTGKVKELSLDHDLGEPNETRTGMDVLVWIKENGFAPPVILLHTANSVAWTKMKVLIEEIQYNNGLM